MNRGVKRPRNSLITLFIKKNKKCGRGLKKDVQVVRGLKKVSVGCSRGLKKGSVGCARGLKKEVQVVLEV